MFEDFLGNPQANLGSNLGSSLVDPGVSALPRADMMENSVEWCVAQGMREGKEKESGLTKQVKTLLQNYKSPRTLILEVPGLKMDDIKVTAAGNQLTITGTCEPAEVQAAAKDMRVTRCERRHGQFSRTFSLVEGTKVDKITSKLHNGVLTVHIPKAEADRGSMSVPIFQVKAEEQMQA